jgi:hypothetical protein
VVPWLCLGRHFEVTGKDGARGVINPATKKGTWELTPTHHKQSQGICSNILGRSLQSPSTPPHLPIP